MVTQTCQAIRTSIGLTYYNNVTFPIAENCKSTRLLWPGQYHPLSLNCWRMSRVVSSIPRYIIPRTRLLLSVMYLTLYVPGFVGSYEVLPAGISGSILCAALTNQRMSDRAPSEYLDRIYVPKSCHVHAPLQIMMRSPPASALCSDLICASATSRTSTHDELYGVN